MSHILTRLQSSELSRLFYKHQKYVPLVFFVGGFLFDSLTLGRIDRLYDLTILSSHMTSLTIVLYFFNLVDDGKWKQTWLEKIEEYFPLAIQFFFGALSSAFVVYFSRSVSFTKTITFFVILIGLLVANEFLKKRIANKYLQFGVYMFISFTFFTFMIPVFVKQMSTTVFLISGGLSLIITLALVIFIYRSSPSTRKEIRLYKLITLICGIYILINSFYFLRLIPPVPLALEKGIVAHHVEKVNDQYAVTYETNNWYIFWRKHRSIFVHTPGQKIFVYSSIFAPTNIDKEIVHSWQWYDETSEEWLIKDTISFKIIGGRDDGYRGYTYKRNVIEGEWKVKVMTEEALELGVITFDLVIDQNAAPLNLITEKF